MSDITICPFCKISLKEVLYEHINSVKHREALTSAGIDHSNDPVIKVIEKLEKPKEELFIPSVPEPSKEESQFKIDPSDLSIEVKQNLLKINSKDYKGVLANCARCDTIIAIPVPRYLIQNSELPVVAVSYIHRNKEGNDQHSLTVYLDRDFDIRRQRYSDVIIAE